MTKVLHRHRVLFLQQWYDPVNLYSELCFNVTEDHDKSFVIPFLSFYCTESTVLYSLANSLGYLHTVSMRGRGSMLQRDVAVEN